MTDDRVYAYEHFGWPQRFPGDVWTEAFEEATSIFDFDWDLAIWWNKSLARAAGAIAREDDLGRLYDPLEDMRTALQGINGRDVFDAIVQRAPWSELRCIGHLEMAIQHIVRVDNDITGKPFMIYDAGTGTWKREGKGLLSTGAITRAGSLIDRIIEQFGIALGRGVDLLHYLVEVVEPDAPDPRIANPNATQQEIDDWEEAQAWREAAFAECKKAHKMARAIPQGKYGAIKSGLRQRLAVEQTSWDSDMRWLIMKDGVLNVEEIFSTGVIKVHEFSPAHMSTMALEVGYGDAVRNAGYSEWQRGVEKVVPDPDVRRYLQKRYGAALMGKPSLAGKSMVWQWGEPNTAKSSIQECIAGEKGVFAPYAIATNADSLTDKGNERGAGERFKAYARGKRFAIMSELDANEMLSQSFLKSVTGGDTVEGTAKYANAVSYFFTATLFMASNHPPRLPAGDTAAANRIHVVPFKHKLWAQSTNPEEWAAAEPEHRANENWKDEVLESAQERAAILRWVLDGLVAFGRDGGLGELPEAMQDAKEEFVADADPVAKLVRSLLGTEPSYEGPAWIKIYSPSEWREAGYLEKDGISLPRMEALIEARAQEAELKIVKFGESLSRRYMNAAKRMIEELGAEKKKAMLDSQTRKTGYVFTRTRELAFDDTGAEASAPQPTWG